MSANLKPLLPVIRDAVQATVKKLVMQILPKIIVFLSKQISNAVSAAIKTVKKRMNKKISNCLTKIEHERDDVLQHIKKHTNDIEKTSALRAQAEVWEKAIEIIKGELGDIDEILDEAEKKIRIEIEETTNGVTKDKDVQKKIDDLIRKKDIDDE